MRVGTRACLIAAAFAAAVGLVACGSGSGHSSAYKLYAIDHGTAPGDEQAPELAPYRRALAGLEYVCANDRSRLADLAVAVRSELKRKHIEVSTLFVMNGVRHATPRHYAGRDCTPTFKGVEMYLASRGR